MSNGFLNHELTEYLAQKLISRLKIAKVIVNLLDADADPSSSTEETSSGQQITLNLPKAEKLDISCPVFDIDTDDGCLYLFDAKDNFDDVEFRVSDDGELLVEIERS